ncbi:MAG: hypothetical protein GF317_18895 [Candidatus Lokiarchaeota archaeon]|nr:hypothetical protein [Candidatus Lokiarchaeota archaeon]MBD3201586.1 hypothetical protein [Candidatus Lokiarchaeota archaeon]
MTFKVLEVYVLIKQVPKSHSLRIDKSSGALIRENIENIINPDDLYALELALTLKESYDAHTVVMTMGPPQAESALREALAMGIDDAVLISDPQFAYSDTLQTTLVIKEAFEYLKRYDLLITGSETSDSSTGQVPYQLSEALDIPLITDIFEYKIEGRNFYCQRNFGHESQNIQVELPIMLRVRRHFNKPRHVPLLGIKKAFEKKIKIIDFNTLNCPDYLDGCNKSPTIVVKTEKFIPKRKNQFIEGTIKEQAEFIKNVMKENGIERQWTGI